MHLFDVLREDFHHIYLTENALICIKVKCYRTPEKERQYSEPWKFGLMPYVAIRETVFTMKRDNANAALYSAALVELTISRYGHSF